MCRSLLLDLVQKLLNVLFRCLFLEQSQNLTTLSGEGRRILGIFEVWNVLFLACRDEGVERSRQSFANTFRERQPDLLVEYTVDKGLLRVNLREVDFRDPV